VELRQLRHFLALAEERNVTRAAEREQIVQSGLSNSIRSLERSLGTVLYVRGTRPVRLTDTGIALASSARQVLSAAAEAEASVRSRQTVLTGLLRVGVMQSAEYLVPLAASLASFAATHPRVEIELRQDSALTMLTDVEEGRLHCAVVPAIRDQRFSVSIAPLAHEPLRLAMRREHPLADRADIRLRDLAQEWFVDVRPDWSARRLNDAAFAQHGIQRRIRCEVNEWLLFVELVAAGLGIGFVPAYLPYPQLRSPDSELVLHDIIDHRPQREICLATPRGDELSAAARAYAAHLKQSISLVASPASQAVLREPATPDSADG
jgi:DNA-binding transcriptional LysR family regulator